MAAVSYMTVMGWLNYWNMPAGDSYDQWNGEFNHVPPAPPRDFTSYDEAATWIAAEYDGPPVPAPPPS